ncbi:putative phage abortive infection protein [Pseudomonas cichorii]|uniref:putative phage abortive infection protein n=1 Tax=Pseudomonas cichorii TaxID=36746 RepID=UPI001C894E1A|nr:putative phage abortive infection protein [Pseudomonas cichorii]MBX8528509.1 putative phage abortive infection protein [Pseudomonas cichorii]
MIKVLMVRAKKGVSLIPSLNKYLVAYAVIVITLVLASYPSNFYAKGLGGQEHWGQFGDYFGGVLNPILSFLALVAVVRGLRFQSEELKSARAEAQSALSIQQEQTKIFKQQSFESVFFGLLQIYSKSVEGLEVTGPDGGRVVGVSVLANISESTNVDQIDWDALSRGAPSIRSSQIKPTVEHHLNSQFLPKVEGGPARCFKILSQLLSHIDTFDLDSPSLKQSYLMITKSLLTPAEIECAALYAISNEGRGLRVLMNSFKLFDDMPYREKLDYLKDSGMLPK